MGGCTSKLVEPSSRKPASRAGSMHTSRAGEPDLSRSSLALAALPPTRPASCGGSSSSDSDSGGGYASSSGSDCSDTVASTVSTAFLASSRAADGSTDGGSTPADGVPHMRRALADIKTTYKLRVGVLEGTTFLNQYIVIDTLGRGSFGKVKLCLNTGDDRLYAVKVVNTRALRATARTRLRMRLRPAARPAAAANGAPGGLATSLEDSAAASSPGGGACELEADLRREVEVMRALDHPNLLRLFEVIEDKEGGKVLMVMEYAEGGALVSPGALTPDRHLPEAMAQCYFRQIAAGLAYLHQHHVVHGDLKPENVMLCGRGTVKIGDFGQSQFFDRRDTFHRTLGTPAYLAPEVCAGQAYRGRQADVWALGVSLYYFIFGQMPFKAPSVLALYDAVAVGEVPYPRTHPISHELQDLFLRLLHRDPSRRITAEEVMHHPWVTLMPDFGAGLESPHDVGEAAAAVEEEGQQHPPLAPFSAEEVAAVLFPLAVQNELAAGGGGSPRGGSPRSPGDGGSTHLVDALAAAATASFGGSMAARLARSNSACKLHKLSQDSMVRRTLASSGQLGSNAAPSNAAFTQASDSGGAVARSAPVDAGASDAASSEAAAAAAAAAGCGGNETGSGVQPGAAAGGGNCTQEFAFGSGLVRTYAEQEEVPVPLDGQQGAVIGDGGFGTPAGPGSSGSGQQACTPAGRQHHRAHPAVQPLPPCPLGSSADDRLLTPNGRPAASRAQAVLPGGQLFARQLTARLQQQGQQQQQQQPQQPQQQQREPPPPLLQPAAEAAPVAGASRATAWRSMLQRVSGGSTQPRGAQADGALDGPSISPTALGTSLPTGGSFDAGRQPPRARSLDLLRSIFTGPADFMGGPQPASWEASRAGNAAGDGGSGGAVGVARTSSGPTPPLAPPRRRAPLLFPGIGDFIEGVAFGPAAPGGTASRLPPRPPPPRPTLQQSVVVNIFRPGERLGQASSATQQQTCFYIEQGMVEVRYEADVPITLSSVLSAAAGIFRRASGPASPSPALSPEAAASPTAALAPAGGAPGASPTQVFAAAVAAAQRQQQGQQGASPQPATGASGPALGPPTPAVGSFLSAGAAAPASHGRQPSPSPPHLGAEDAGDSSVLGSHTFDLGVSAELQRQGSELMQRSASLAETVAQATLRAKALLNAAQAKGASLDHLLVCERTTGEFLGSLAMLDPSFLMGRWKATAVAKSHVVALHMTRQGLEQFLQQHPLAQVHLRASMACARAEVVKLEALEKIAVARQHQAQVQERQRPRRPRSQRSAPTSRRGSTLPTGAAVPTTPALSAAPLGAPQGALAAAAAAAAEQQQQQAAPAAAVAAEQPAADAGAAPAAAVAALEDAQAPGVPSGAAVAERAAVSATAQQQVSAAAAGKEAAAAAAAAAGEEAAAGGSGEEEDEAARDYAAAAEAAAAVEEKEREEEDGDTLSSASSSSSSEEEEEEAGGASQLPAGRQLSARRPPGISVSEAHSTTLELFRVVSQLREAISDQLRDRLANRTDAEDSLAGLLPSGRSSG